MKIREKISVKIIGILSLLFVSSFSSSIADSILVNEYISSPSTGSTTTKYGTLASGTYTSKVQNIEGYTRVKGLIITDGSAAPTLCTINQLAGGTNTSVWHGTDTVVFTQSGALWRGEIDFPTFGRFIRTIVGGFGTATFFSMNLFSSEGGRDMGSTWLDTVTTVGTTTIELAPQSSARKYILILNEGTSTDCYISGNTPFNPNTDGILLKSNNGYWSDERGVYYNAIYGITKSGTTSVRITEIK